MYRGVDELDPSSQVAGNLRREALLEGRLRVSREVVQDYPDLLGLRITRSSTRRRIE